MTLRLAYPAPASAGAHESLLTDLSVCSCPDRGDGWIFSIEDGFPQLEHVACGTPPWANWMEISRLVGLDVQLRPYEPARLDPYLADVIGFEDWGGSLDNNPHREFRPTHTLNLTTCTPPAPETYCPCDRGDNTWTLAMAPGGYLTLTHKACGAAPYTADWQGDVDLDGIQVRLVTNGPGIWLFPRRG